MVEECQRFERCFTTFPIFLLLCLGSGHRAEVHALHARHPMSKGVKKVLGFLLRPTRACFGASRLFSWEDSILLFGELDADGGGELSLQDVGNLLAATWNTFNMMKES